MIASAQALIEKKERLRDQRSPALCEQLRANSLRYSHRMAAAWKPRKQTPPPQWLQRNMRLDRMIEAGGGRYELSRRPWWRQILSDFADPEVRSISVMAATQVGKTLALIAAILWCAEHSPAPGMVVLPDKDTAIEFRDRVYYNALATIKRGESTRLRVPSPYKWNTRYIDLGAMRIYLAWSGSRQRLRGRPCRYVWLSEVDVYKGDKKSGDPIAAAHQRSKAFFRGLHYHESSPSEYPSEISDLEAAAAGRFRWHVQCPHCDRWQELRFFTHARGAMQGKGGVGGYKDEQGELLSIEEARSKAHYVCEAGCEIGNEQKQTLIESGQWVPFGCHVGPDGEIIGKQPRSRRSRGYHLWSVHSEATTWGDLAASHVEAKQAGKLAEWWGNWLGLAYRPESKVPTWAQLGTRLAWTHARRTVPPEVWFLTAGVDVQGENNGVRYVIRGWGPQVTSWLIDWGWIDRDPGDENDLVKSDLRKAGEQLLDQEFPIVGGGSNPLGRKFLQVRLTNCDSNNLPMKVHAWLRSLPESWVYGETPRVRAIRGDHQVKPELRWRMNVIETNTRTGEVYEGGMPQWGLYVYPFYDEFLQRLSGEPGKPGSWYVTADCYTQGKAYLEQVTNFERSIELDEKTGQKKTIWRPRNRRIPVDFWDCEIYARVAAEMVVGDLGWNVERWEAWRQQSQPDPKGTKSRRRPRGNDDYDLSAR